MQFVLIGLVIVCLLVLVGRGQLRANPAMLAGLVRNGAGILTLAAVALAVLRGQMGLGGLLLAFAVWLLSGARRPSWPGFLGGGQTPAGWLDLHAGPGGELTGRVLKGAFAGRSLADLSFADCVALHRDCLAADLQGARRLEAYLDRRFPGWRPAGDADTDAGAAFRRRGGAGMTEQQACQILGIKQPATTAEIGGAHRTLMKKCHPDHGGTAAEAARVNEARDVLMARHK